MAGGWPGLKDDCEALLGAFRETDSVRFEDFASLWRQRRFHTIFYGKIRALEQNKFTKECLALVWPYFLPPHTFQIRVGALYLLYGLYNTQLCQPKQKIRVALKDWSAIMNFQQELLNAEHYDAAYIFRKLRVDKAFYFTAMPKLLSFRAKRASHDAAEIKREFKDPSDRVSELATNDVIEELENVHKHYQRMKCLISMDKTRPDKALDLIKDDFVVSFKNMILEHQQWQKDKLEPSLTVRSKKVTSEEEGTSQESEASERARTLASIKAKSYSTVAQVSKSRRHRQVILESSASESDHGVNKSPRAKNNRIFQPVTKGKSLRNAETLQAIKAEGAVRRLSMPVITEDAAEDRKPRMPVIPEDDDDDDDEVTDNSSDEEFLPAKKKRIL
ncbi:snRNA-activating protein complex subunit 1 [Heteronotia binoei]|uniref:snRNA-activating protein complex subunit 1 n=1 Tax=Heteronotia binoei TaxID=13085 RepID=UPI00292F6460|nr:snRNA-activating protein complex subunit 1 [Heteronotia binoei]